MESFFKLCQCVKADLGRELQMKEVDFLRWVYDNYKKELQDTDQLNHINPND